MQGFLRLFSSLIDPYFGSRVESADNHNMSENQTHSNSWSKVRRRFASIIILTHLTAVVVAPWSSPPPAPLLAETAARVFAPYQAATYINHGYRFFAPNPGPSHIVRFEAKRADGKTVSGQLPDTVRNWPRLLYHRHFMITETLYSYWSSIETIPPDVEVTKEQRALVDRQNAFPQQQVDELAEGIANQLIRKLEVETVQLKLVEHAIPYPQDVLDGKPLNAPDLYIELADLGKFPRQP